MSIFVRRYCSLWDSQYLAQGLALYDSLDRHSKDPCLLNVLAMDEECEQALRSLRLRDMNVFGLGVVEDRLKLKSVRESRTWQEFNWTMASQFTCWLMLGTSRPDLEITYLDADTFFFSDPEAVFAEIGDKSIAVVPHRFPPERKHMEVNGRFNVSWVTFRGPVGFKCLETWARQCREKCSATEGCGDQKYLDSFEGNYPGQVCAIQNIGVGLAPWNVSQYEVIGDWHDEVMLRDGPLRQSLVMYHFHEYQHGKRLTNYKLREQDIKWIYEPYIAAVNEAKMKVDSLMTDNLKKEAVQ